MGRPIIVFALFAGVFCVVAGAFWVYRESSPGLAGKAPLMLLLIGAVFLLNVITRAARKAHDSRTRETDTDDDPVTHLQRMFPRPEEEDDASRWGRRRQRPKTPEYPNAYCPFCEAVLTPGLEYCRKCGRYLDTYRPDSDNSSAGRT
jgi:hypothetical protein